MNYVVAKDFNTKIQRLKAGQKIDSSTDIFPFNFEERVQRGFLTEESTGLVEVSQAPAADAPSITITPATPPTPPAGRRSALSTQNVEADEGKA